MQNSSSESERAGGRMGGRANGCTAGAWRAPGQWSVETTGGRHGTKGTADTSDVPERLKLKIMV